MSLNHLVQGGSLTPPLNLECENLKILNVLQVGGEIQTGAFQSENFDPTIAISSTGTGQSLISNVYATATRIGDETRVTYRCTFASGTGASKLNILFTTPVWTPNPQAALSNLSCVLNCTHLRGDGAWESLINQGVSVGQIGIGPTDDAFRVTVGREDNMDFPATKDFTLTATFTYSQE